MSRLEAIHALHLSPLTIAQTEQAIANGTDTAGDIKALGDANVMIAAKMKGEDPTMALFFHAVATADNPQLATA